MIPASYFFKDVYHQAWSDPDIEAAIERQDKPAKGRLIWSWLVAALARLHTDRLTGQPFGSLTHE